MACKPVSMETAVKANPPATNLALVRRTRGITLDALAVAVGSTADQVSRIEHRYRRPSSALRQRLAAALEIDPADLLESP